MLPLKLLTTAQHFVLNRLCQRGYRSLQIVRRTTATTGQKVYFKWWMRWASVLCVPALSSGSQNRDLLSCATVASQSAGFFAAAKHRARWFHRLLHLQPVWGTNQASWLLAFEAYIENLQTVMMQKHSSNPLVQALNIEPWLDCCDFYRWFDSCCAILTLKNSIWCLDKIAVRNYS